jgi:hypothetical protein
MTREFNLPNSLLKRAEGTGSGRWRVPGCLGDLRAGAEDRRGGERRGLLSPQVRGSRQRVKFLPRPYSREPSDAGGRVAAGLTFWRVTLGWLETGVGR